MKKVLFVLMAFIFTINVNAQKIMSNYQGRTAKMSANNNPDQITSTAKINNQIYAGESRNIVENNTLAVSIITLGTSANALGLYGNGRTYLWADDDIDAVILTHRASATPGSGFIQYDVSKDGGSTWSVNLGPVYTPDGTISFNARYPQGGIYNPVGNTNPDDAYAVYFAPTLEGSNMSWGGMAYGVHKLDNIQTATQDVFSTGSGFYYAIPKAFHINQTGEAWFADWNDSLDGSGNSYSHNNEMQLCKGLWNTGTTQYDYSRSVLQIPMSGHPTSPLRKYIADQKIAFAPDGQTGYIAIIGHNDYSFMPDSVYYPILYKTTDGGTTWNGPINVELSVIPEIQTIYGDTIIYSTGFELDLAVDNNGNPYMTFDVSPATGNWSLATSPGYIASTVVFSTDGGTTWDARILDYIETFRGVFGAGTASELPSDNRNQISCNKSGTKMFMTWLDTDTLTFGSADGNYYPDIHLRAIDVASGNMTSTYNVTTGTMADGASYMGSASYYVFENAGSYEVPLMYQEMDPTNTTMPVTYQYIKGFTINDAEFANISPAGTILGLTSVCQGQTSVTYTVAVIAGADSYVWTLPSGATGSSSTNSITVDFSGSAVSGNITVHGHNSIGDGATSSLYINVYPIPSTPTAGNNGPVCEGTALSLNTSTVSSATYSWTGPNSFISSSQNPTVSSSASSLMAGTYNVTVSVHGCISTPGSTTVVVKPKPSAPVAGNNGPVCNGASLTLDATTITGATYAWTGPGGFTSTQQNPIVSTSATAQMTGIYYIHSILNGCTSINASTTVTIIAQAPVEEICFVEFDTTAYKNNINWTNNLPVNVDSIHIYNEVSTNVWSLIGSVPAADSNFVDMNSNPFSQSYSYKITTIDSCGNESDSSQHHTTITLLAAYDLGTDTYGFTWSAYQGLTVPNYVLYGLTAGGAVSQIGSVPGNQYFYNYLHPDASYIRYFVAFITPTCDSKGNYLVKSNWIQSATVGIAEAEDLISKISIFPNPVSDILNIQTSLQIEKIEITDVFGRLIYRGVQKTVNCSEFTDGIYFVRIFTTSEIIDKKFMKD
jgi:hypothetical protein